MTERFRRRSEDSSLLEWPDCPVEKWKDMVFEASPTLTLAWEGPCVTSSFFKEFAPTSLFEAFQKFKYNEDDIRFFPLGYLISSPLISLSFTNYITNNCTRVFKPRWSKPEFDYVGDPGLLFSIRISSEKRKVLYCGGNNQDEATNTWRTLKKYYDEIPRPIP